MSDAKTVWIATDKSGVSYVYDNDPSSTWDGYEFRAVEFSVVLNGLSDALGITPPATGKCIKVTIPAPTVEEVGPVEPPVIEVASEDRRLPVVGVAGNTKVRLNPQELLYRYGITPPPPGKTARYKLVLMEGE